VALPALAAVKVALYRTMLQRGMRKADLARLTGAKPMQVDRLLDLSHASRLAQIEAARRTLGKEIAIEVRDASAGWPGLRASRRRLRRLLSMMTNFSAGGHGDAHPEEPASAGVSKGGVAGPPGRPPVATLHG